MHLYSLLPYLFSLLQLITFAECTLSLDFTSPQPDATWTVGSQQLVSWESDYNNYTISLNQVSDDESYYIGGPGIVGRFSRSKSLQIQVSPDVPPPQIPQLSLLSHIEQGRLTSKPFPSSNLPYRTRRPQLHLARPALPLQPKLFPKIPPNLKRLEPRPFHNRNLLHRRGGRGRKQY